MSDVLRIEREGDVVTLTITRDERMNALTSALLIELREAMAGAVADGARAIVLTGEGRAFSSGADLQGDGIEPPCDLGELLEGAYNPLARAIADLSVPLIVAVNGAAVGAGMGFALAGDIVIAERSAYFLLAFANIGLVPDAGATWMVARSVGRARALELALLGEKITADAAKDMGLITRVVDDGTSLAEAQALAAKLAAGPSLALGQIRKQVAFALDHEFTESLAEEARNQKAAGFTEDFAEAVTAFREKRKPIFKGR
ncbi:enoyl-CoA hydratase-related protein [Croceicoccus naphthovorans]|uniref:Enoyl-CoA hydratase n=1 Tax=Croceicoccus naphthovorans TaxID=1348774 RepID=A0A0G3XFU4_9SPHN|nr:enoyl-CoA hydratase-related protein [Croceicoccus naphthovorans]AKM10410.1 enoyl-CoA hydratase [Croceicoccus naphthovorans]MBB3990110.1 2-(1,2-epoxy-1,2-dihydrophenyl)acetyl-CoA isomerase [Croceicoccus naphthovorans]